jgi:threonine synthase
LGLIPGDSQTALYGAQATGCSPITRAVKEGWELFRPVKPNTIARSLAIGNPADGFYAIRTIRDSKGWGEDVSDEEVVQGIRLLAETEGVFTETAGGVTVAAAKKLIEQGRIPRNESIVLAVTGNGLKTVEAVAESLSRPDIIEPRLTDFEKLCEKLHADASKIVPATVA